jgi:hypothetical protein
MTRGVTCGYHCTAKPVSFGKGQSAVHTAAYNAREQLHQEREDRKTRDYSRHEGEVLFKGIFAPDGAPEWTQDRQELWNRAEAAERQKANGQPARNMIVAFPHELNQQQREWLVKDFAREAFARKGMIADVAMHAPDAKGDERNYHAHILLTMRNLDGDEFAKTKKQCRHWNSKEQLAEWREQWAERGAKALHRAGYPVEAERWRQGHKTLGEQRAAALERGDKEFAESLGSREPTMHKGAKTTAVERRLGASNERLGRVKEVIERNDIRLEMKALDREAAGLERQAALARLEQAAKADEKALRKPVARDYGVEAWLQAQEVRQERRDEKGLADQLTWKKRMDEQKPGVATPDVAKTGERGLQVADKATGAVMGLADYLSTLVSGHTEKPAPEHDKGGVGGIIHDDPKLRKEQQLARYAAVKAEREADKALERMEDDMKQGRSLSASDVQNLTPAHQMTLLHFGDDGMRQLVEDLHKRKERDGGRERD